MRVYQIVIFAFAVVLCAIPTQAKRARKHTRRLMHQPVINHAQIKPTISKATEATSIIVKPKMPAVPLSTPSVVLSQNVVTQTPLTVPPSTTDELARFDQKVKECDTLLKSTQIASKQLDSDGVLFDSYALLLNTATENTSQAKLNEYTAWARYALGKIKVDLEELRPSLLKIASLSQEIHSSPLFDKYYFIGDRIISSKWTDTKLWGKSGLSSVGDTELRYIESSKPGLGRPASDIYR